MSAGDTARVHYASTREEIIRRIELRDNVLLLYLAAVGTVFGVALGTSAQREILLVIPFLALGASSIVSQHHSLIGFLAYFLVSELEPFMREIGEYAPQWDGSKTLLGIGPRFPSSGRTVGQLLLLASPPLAALAFNWTHFFSPPLIELLVAWIGVGLTMVTISQILVSHRQRKEIYGQMRCKQSESSVRTK